MRSSATNNCVPADFIVIGSGIAGASVAHALAPHAKVVVLERESQPGYHSTGRSAALFMESYGSAQVRALTVASRSFFENPPAGFADHPLLTPRGAMMVANPDQSQILDSHWEVLSAISPNAKRLSADEACALVPVLRRERLIGAVYEPDAADMDVHAIHHGYLRSMRRAGGTLVTNAEVIDVSRHTTASWQVKTASASYLAPVVINAAGAWADVVAAMAGLRPLGLQPRRRSALTFRTPVGLDTSGWPLVFDAGESWYFKPDAGMLLGSPANADPVEPQDVQPDELDIALAVHRIEEATTLTVTQVESTWAGLRSFVHDGGLVGGFEDDAPGYFWLAAQGGYGIQTSPAMADACAALLRGLPFPERLGTFGLTALALGPERLRANGSPTTNEQIGGASNMHNG